MNKSNLKEFKIFLVSVYYRVISTKQKKCNICGGRYFIKGPSGRLAKTGMYPRCTKCLSLERHRIHRKISEQIKSNFDLKNKFSVLQFSSDVSFEKSWFLKFENSIYEGSNHLDIQGIDRSDDTYDLVIINHVLEHVSEDKKALSELLRIIKKDGFIFLSVPDTTFDDITVDWKYPKKELHGHYRSYGKDFYKIIEASCPGAFWLRVLDFDDSTISPDEVYLITKSEETLRKLKRGLRISNS